MVLTGVHWSLPLASWNIYWCPELSVAQCVSEKILGSPFSSFRSRLLNNMQDLIKHKGYSKLESNSSRRNFRGTGERPKLPSIQAYNLSCSYRHTSNQHKLAAEQCSTFQPSFIPLSYLDLASSQLLAGTSTWSDCTVTQTGELIHTSSNIDHFPDWVYTGVPQGKGWRGVPR